MNAECFEELYEMVCYLVIANLQNADSSEVSHLSSYVEAKAFMVHYYPDALVLIKSSLRDILVRHGYDLPPVEVYTVKQSWVDKP